MSFDSILARSPYIIYKPGGVAAGLVVTSWAQVQKFVVARGGAVIVLVDDSIVSPAHVPAATGVTDFQGRGEIRPYRQDFLNFSTLQVDNGATLKGIFKLSGTIDVVGDTQGATPAFDWDYTANVVGSPQPIFFVSDFASIGTTTTATAPTIVVPAAKELFAQFEGNGSAFVQQLVAPFVHLAAASSVFRSFMFGAEMLGPGLGAMPASWIDGAGTSELEYDAPTVALSPGGAPPSNAATALTVFLDADLVVTQFFPASLINIFSAGPKTGIRPVRFTGVGAGGGGGGGAGGNAAMGSAGSGGGGGGGAVYQDVVINVDFSHRIDVVVGAGGVAGAAGGGGGGLGGNGGDGGPTYVLDFITGVVLCAFNGASGASGGNTVNPSSGGANFAGAQFVTSNNVPSNTGFDAAGGGGGAGASNGEAGNTNVTSFGTTVAVPIWAGGGAGLGGVAGQGGGGGGGGAGPFGFGGAGGNGNATTGTPGSAPTANSGAGGGGGGGGEAAGAFAGSAGGTGGSGQITSSFEP